ALSQLEFGPTVCQKQSPIASKSPGGTSARPNNVSAATAVLAEAPERIGRAQTPKPSLRTILSAQSRAKEIFLSIASLAILIASFSLEACTVVNTGTDDPSTLMCLPSCRRTRACHCPFSLTNSLMTYSL